MHDDFEACYAAVSSRDTRFDGWFFTAVTSTGIYCRPSCPAVTPKRENVRFFPSSAAAQQAGFRACMRCRPDATPGSPQWLGRSDTVARAMRLILDGTVERQGVGGLAGRLGYSERQLHRLLTEEVGAGALALARAQRAQTARILLQTTLLPVAQVASAAGFASVRQFNETSQAVFARTPTQLREAFSPEPDSAGRITLQLAHRKPFAARELLGFLAARALAPVEQVHDGAYSRTLRLAGGRGRVELCSGDGDSLQATFQLESLSDLMSAIARVRHLANLDADPLAIDATLACDPLLRASVRRRPGVRVAGAVDGFELAVRAVIGQQVSVAGARTVAERIVAASAQPDQFPGPAELLEISDTVPQAFAMPSRRRGTLVALANAALDGRLHLDPGADIRETRAQLLALPGVGPWTTEYIAMRALGDPDAFLPSDLGVRRALERRGERADPRSAEERAQRWRPWRAHALFHLWSTDGSNET